MESKRLYFDTEEKRDEYNREAARARGCDMVLTVFWYSYGHDEKGYYVEIDDMGENFPVARVYFTLSSNADELNARLTAYEADRYPELYEDGSVWCEPQWDDVEKKWYVIVKDPEHLEFVEQENILVGIWGYFIRLFR